MIKFIYKNLRHAEYRLPCSQRIKEKVTRYFKQRYLHFGNTASMASKLVGVKWCDIHREWNIKV